MPRAPPAFCVLRNRTGSAGGHQQREVDTEQTKALEVETGAHLEQRAAHVGLSGGEADNNLTAFIDVNFNFELWGMF
jgi:hypothetical protein